MNINVSILGLYNFNPAIFDGLTLPEGMEQNLGLKKCCICRIQG